MIKECYFMACFTLLVTFNPRLHDFVIIKKINILIFHQIVDLRPTVLGPKVYKTLEQYMFLNKALLDFNTMLYML